VAVFAPPARAFEPGRVFVVRIRRRFAGLASVLVAGGILFGGTWGASAGTACGTSGVFAQSGSTVTCTYTATGEDTFAVPAGVTGVSVTAVGAPGGAGGAFTYAGGVGGLGAMVVAPSVSVSGLSTLYVEVGGAGGIGGTGTVSPPPCAAGSAGAGGGGAGGDASCREGGGGGGGGASDVRTQPAADGGLTAAVGDPRLVVAGGGGGGSGAYGPPTAGGAAGVAGVSGAGAGGSADCEASSASDGGSGETGAGGGAGGTVANSYGCLVGYAVGADGDAGSGGSGANGYGIAPGAGGGGGGYVGGGGGAVASGAGGGGGGGGSSFGPTGTSFATALATQAPEVAISYTVPLASPSISTSQQPATATVGNSVADKATVSGGDSPTGTVTFSLYSNSTASGTPLFTDANVPLVSGTATSTGYEATATGTDYWVATYNGDTNNNSVTSGTAAEPVTITSVTTSLTAAPQVLLPGFRGVGLGVLSATLTGAGKPLSGQTITFSVAGHRLCSAQTNSSGVARCTISPSAEVVVLFYNQYTATSTATSSYLGSTASTKAIIF